MHKDKTKTSKLSCLESYTIKQKLCGKYCSLLLSRKCQSVYVNVYQLIV